MEAVASPITGLQYPILVGDIGGTNARFAILKDSLSEPLEFPVARNADHGSLEQSIQNTVLDHTSIHPNSAILAIAAPVSGDEVPLTNLGWTIRPAALTRALRFNQVVLVNDFEAQALAVLALGTEHMRQIGGGEPRPGAPCVVLGPGTGLGVAGLVSVDGVWIPVAGEGGHVDIGPRSAREAVIFEHLQRLEGRVSAEEVLSGRGLANLYRAVSKADGKEPRLVEPADISAAGLARTEPAAVEALGLFAVLLGRLAGDMALIFMARGGVFLTGGIAQKILPALTAGPFRAAFEDKAPHSARIAQIPVMVVTHPLAALSGLAALARTPQRFGIDLASRCWRRDD